MLFLGQLIARQSILWQMQSIVKSFRVSIILTDENCKSLNESYSNWSNCVHWHILDEK